MSSESPPCPPAFVPVVSELIAQCPLSELGPGTPHGSVEPSLRRLSPQELFGDRTIVDDQMARCCLSGLWLLHNFLDESHRISQEIDTPTGSYWHGIMHRRELDFGNAKYWFRRVRSHPVFEELRGWVSAHPPSIAPVAEWKGVLARHTWDPDGFVDLCEQAVGRTDAFHDSVRTVAQAEWRLLFDFCYRQAISR